MSEEECFCFFFFLIGAKVVFSKEKNGLGWTGKGDADPSTGGRCSGSRKAIHGDSGEDL